MRTVFLSSVFFLSVATLKAQPAMDWYGTFGGSLNEVAYSIEPTTDGIAFLGYSNSSDGDVGTNQGGIDCWLVQLHSNHGIEWEKNYGGSGTDRAYKLLRTTDGGFVFAGTTSSTDGDVTGNHGASDIWVVKVTAIGNISWQKTIGGTGNDYGASLTLTSDGGYAVAGVSSSNDGDVSGNHGGQDIVVSKLSSTGTVTWTKSLGGSDYDEANAIAQCSDGGYIVAGGSSSNDGDVSGNHGDSDFWVVKLNASGPSSGKRALGEPPVSMPGM